MSKLPDDEVLLTEDEAKKRAARMLADPKHDRARGHKDDERTRDDDMSDPKHNEE